MSCVNIQQIYDTECIGASLPKINGNFAALSAAVCTLSSSSVLSVADTNTIDLTVSNKELIADVKTDSIRYSHLASWQTLSASPTLSAEAVQPRLAKAWVTFNGTTTVPSISSAFNVSSITDGGTGYYTINYISPVPKGYTVCNQCDTAAAFTWAFIYDSAYNLQTSTSITVGKLIGSTGSITDSVWISHTIFGY